MRVLRPIHTRWRESPLPRQTKVELYAAIVDRLTLGGHIIETGTDFYRLARTAQAKAAAAG
jgi:hypothetical protein